jgi:hypothetical protein
LRTIAWQLGSENFACDTTLWRDRVPFSSLNDPVDVARAQAAIEAAWGQVRKSLKDDANPTEEWSRLARIVLDLVGVAVDETDLARRAVERFSKMPPGADCQGPL